MPLTVITGPPGSGKTTYAHAHAAPGDIIIDFDALAAALSMPGADGDSYPEHIAAVTRAAWWAAMNAALKASREGAGAWLIHAYPPPAARRNYEQHAAEFVLLGNMDPEQAALQPSRPSRGERQYARW